MCMARAAFLTALLAASALSTGNVAFGAPPRLNAVAQQKSLSMQIFWQRLLQILRQNGGYISVERFQKDFGMTLEKGAEEGDEQGGGDSIAWFYMTEHLQHPPSGESSWSN